MDCTDNSKNHGEELPQGDGVKKIPTQTKKGRPTRARYVGVRQRPSGRWVAEIKVSSQKLRLWLGTFDSAEEAAMAYDSAARLLRGGNAKTNFPSPETINHIEESSILLSKNPRVHQLVNRAILKGHAKPTSTVTPAGAETSAFGPCDQDNVLDPQRSMNGGLGCLGLQKWEGFAGVPLKCSRVYSSVVVAPSFGVELDSGEK